MPIRANKGLGIRDSKERETADVALKESLRMQEEGGKNPSQPLSRSVLRDNRALWSPSCGRHFVHVSSLFICLASLRTLASSGRAHDPLRAPPPGRRGSHRARPAPRGGGRSLRDRLGCKWRGRELPPLPVVPERQPPPHRGAAPAGPRPAPAHWLRAPGAASGRSRRRPPSVLCLSLARRPPAFVCPHIAFTARALPPPGANLLCRSWRRDDGGDRIADLGRRRVQPAIDTQGSSGADLQKWPGPLLPRFTR